MAGQQEEIDIRMDPDDLYLEEVFTDRRVGSIQRLTPVDAQGAADPGRPVLYVGQTQLMTRAGPLPLSFEIPGTSLGEAAQGFAAAANEAVEDAMRRLDEMRREAASSIIVPEGGVPPGGVPGAGKIQIP
jgi:hypothetical protein